MNSFNSLKEDSNLFKIRHSLAHIMAQAVQRIWPKVKLGFGPATDYGFYYDFVLNEQISQDDFKLIEKEMKKIIGQNQEFTYTNLPIKEAYQELEKLDETFKLEYAKELVKKNKLETLSFYSNGEFIDMCEGPHVKSTKEIQYNCFKLRNISGAYWRGDSEREMMIRIYAWAFENKDDLVKNIQRYNEGLKRDHKKLGNELELFHFDSEIGAGLPLWLPNGTVIREELEKYMKSLEFQAGFQTVVTPHLANTSLYEKTGHLAYYAEDMFPFIQIKNEDNEVKEEYCLKPMNCPHHHKIFESKIRSYKELPLRLAEYGQVYRYEDHGALSGLLRTRGLCINDGHIYCREDQIKDEFLTVMEMHKELYKTLGIKKYHMRLSTWDPDAIKSKYVNNPEAWEKTERLIKEAMLASGLPFVEGKGEAAFYGPKIDFQFCTVTGREETVSTGQLDFAVPERLGMKYIGSDNKEHTPYVIHRAPASTHERFIAFLIEHFGGAFPTWLAPVQVKIITVNEQFDNYAQEIVDDLRKKYYRVELDKTTDSLNKKIKNASKMKIPNILIIGNNEVQDNTVTLRQHGLKEQKTIPLDEFKHWIKLQIESRVLNEHVLLK